jgi:hypothetical protein
MIFIGKYVATGQDYSAYHKMSALPKKGDIFVIKECLEKD